MLKQRDSVPWISRYDAEQSGVYAKARDWGSSPEISLPAIDGTIFDMSSMKGKRVIFTFFRFSCPFCNMRIDELVKRWDEFAEGTVMVGVFDARIDELTKRMGKRAFLSR